MVEKSALKGKEPLFGGEHKWGIPTRSSIKDTQYHRAVKDSEFLDRFLADGWPVKGRELYKDPLHAKRRLVQKVTQFQLRVIQGRHLFDRERKQVLIRSHRKTRLPQNLFVIRPYSRKGQIAEIYEYNELKVLLWAGKKLHTAVEKIPEHGHGNTLRKLAQIQKTYSLNGTEGVMFFVGKILEDHAVRELRDHIKMEQNPETHAGRIRAAHDEIAEKSDAFVSFDEKKLIVSEWDGEFDLLFAQDTVWRRRLVGLEQRTKFRTAIQEILHENKGDLVFNGRRFLYDAQKGGGTFTVDVRSVPKWFVDLFGKGFYTKKGFIPVSLWARQEQEWVSQYRNMSPHILFDPQADLFVHTSQAETLIEKLHLIQERFVDRQQALEELCRVFRPDDYEMIMQEKHKWETTRFRKGRSLVHLIDR